MTTLDRITKISDVIQGFLPDELHEKIVQQIKLLAYAAHLDGKEEGLNESKAVVESVMNGTKPKTFDQGFANFLEKITA